MRKKSLWTVLLLSFFLMPFLAYAAATPTKPSFTPPDSKNGSVQSVVTSAVVTAPLATRPFVRSGNLARFTYGAWIAFWKKAPGMAEVSAHADLIKEVSPFSYEVNPDGTLIDKFRITTASTTEWLQAMRTAKVRIIPTVAWFDADGLDKLLRNKKTRATHESEILKMVTTSTFDGVDIDYENKKAETKIYFSAFLKELSQKLHAKKKKLACTIEPRTPAASRFVVIPKVLEYANDYKVIAASCDEVRVMAYDQGTFDLLLDKEKGSNGNYYVPVADTSWVRKVFSETLPTIPRSKVLLGIPNYGYEYVVTRSSSTGITGFDTLTTSYKRLRAVTYQSATALAASAGVVPQRNSANELSFTYSTSTPEVSRSTMPTDTSSTLPGTPAMQTHLVWFEDAVSLEEKVVLAKRFNLAGVYIFKLDGETDSAFWNAVH